MLGSPADPLLLRNPWPIEQYTSGVVRTFDGALATARGLWLKADDEADWRDDIFYGLAAAYGVVGLVALVRCPGACCSPSCRMTDQGTCRPASATPMASES